MQNHKLTLTLHPSILSRPVSVTIITNSSKTILQSIVDALKEIPEAYQVLINEGRLRPGYLVLSNKVELQTTHAINEKVNKDLEIRIIPVSHGG